jgi:hypothetical protein
MVVPFESAPGNDPSREELLPVTGHGRGLGTERSLLSAVGNQPRLEGRCDPPSRGVAAPHDGGACKRHHHGAARAPENIKTTAPEMKWTPELGPGIGEVKV